ncbi:hypothetical protein FPE01S_02_05420 [Flavihumibacter petaseus NBRC 106054]|uniref:Integral membrane protein n=1 Tax=Flavihumibacter petaseus NBRC 106054 TaxID=1220578 RepID=A0A0E9N0B7_9BACT|nr:hypothetical protein FPE01S_02_05420 [Flavihumibacter petaseus NBRC 106054]
MWFSVIGQLYLIIENRQQSLTTTIIRFFTYFTILTNILVAICYTAIAWFPLSAAGKFFQRASPFTAVTVYICIVGIVYQLLLRHVWNPQGFQKLVDELLHTVNPLAALAVWWWLKPAGKIPFTQLLPWLVYPVLYLGWVLTYGAYSGYYPYPFVNVSQLGYPVTLLHALYIALFFLLLGSILILTANRRHRNAIS